MDNSEEVDPINENEATDSLGFAVSLIGFCIFFLYTMFPKIFQGNMDSATVILWQMLRIFVIVIILCLMFFIFLSGYSLSSRLNSSEKKSIQVISSYIYEVSFYLIVIALFFALSMYSYTSYLISNTTLHFVLSLVFIVAFVLVVIYLAIRQNSATFFIFLIMLIIASFIMVDLNIASTSSDIEIKMENVYDLQNSPIPIEVSITGLNNNLTVGLFKENNSVFPNSTNQYIPFNVNNPDKVVYGGCLFGTYLGYGLYDIYVNTTELTPGYYELRFQVQQHLESKTFFITDKQHVEKDINLSLDTQDDIKDAGILTINNSTLETCELSI